MAVLQKRYCLLLAIAEVVQDRKKLGLDAAVWSGSLKRMAVHVRSDFIYIPFYFILLVVVPCFRRFVSYEGVKWSWVLLFFLVYASSSRP